MADNDLISFIASMSGEGNLRVEENLGEGFVRLRVSEAERRQAKHDIQHVEDIVVEMLRNARDAGARNIYVATSKEEGVRTLLFIDDGDGVPEDMRERIFDARVTSKLESMKMDRLHPVPAWGHRSGYQSILHVLLSVPTNRAGRQSISPMTGPSFAPRVPIISCALSANLLVKNVMAAMFTSALQLKSPLRFMNGQRARLMLPSCCLWIAK